MQIVDDPNKQKDDKNSAQEQNEYYAGYTPRRYYLTGVALLIFGVFYLLDRATNLDVPLNFIQWEWIIIIVGIHLAEKSRFTGVSWIVCIGIGAWFLLDNFIPDLNLRLYFGPLLVIGVGLYLIFGRQRSSYRKYTHMQSDQYKKYTNQGAFSTEGSESDDYLDVVTVFGGSKKMIYTKSFKGGEAVSIFGGTEINLSQADFEGQVVLELTQIFGGATLIIPPHWDMKRNEMVSIFGGVEDNRPTTNTAVDHKKQLILKGTNIFGGIEIKSY